MKNGRLRLFGLAAVLCTLLTGRSKTVPTGTDQPPVKPSEPSCRTATGPPPPFLSRRAPPPVAHYSGTIGRLPVVLILRRSGGTLAGFYFYDKIRSPIQLRGEVRDDDFTLAEFGDVLAPEKRTGTFDGHTEAAPDVLRGTWSSADGQRRLPFMLTRGAPQVRWEVLFTWNRPSQVPYFEQWQSESDYSPVSNTLVYVAREGVLAAFDLATMTSRSVLTMPFQGTPGSPAVGAMMLSHGGDRIAFSAGPPTAPDVYVASLDAPQPLRLTDAAGDYKKDGTYYFSHMWPKFSPDDKTVLFQTLSGGASLTHPNNSVSVVSAAGGAIQRLGEGYSERAYWSADGSRVCSYTQRQNRVVYEVASGRAFVAPTDSALRDPERACRIIAAAASLDTCEEPRAVDDLTDDRLYHGGGERPARHWLTPDIVLTTYEWRQGGRPGYRIQLARALAGTD